VSTDPRIAEAQPLDLDEMKRRVSRDTEIERYGKNRTSERLRDENAVLDATRRHEDRDTEIERIADALESLEPGEHMDDGNWPAALYAVGLRSQPASEPTTWAAPTSAPSLDVERLASAVSMVNLGYHEVGDHRARGSTTRRQRGCGMNREHKRCWRCCVRERGWHRCLSL